MKLYNGRKIQKIKYSTVLIINRNKKSKEKFIT
jgi:hypothetical protein